MSNIGLGLMAGNVLMNILINGVISYLWRALSDLSSITILFMIAIPIYGSAQAVSAMLLQFSQLDILPADLINSYVFTFDENDDPVNSYFDIVGISHHNSIRNMGSTFIFMVLDIGILIIIGMARILRIAKINKMLER